MKYIRTLLAITIFLTAFYSSAQRSWCSIESDFASCIWIIQECPDTVINDTLMIPLHIDVYGYQSDTLYFEHSAGVYLIEIDNRVYLQNFQGIHILYDFNAKLNDTLLIDYPQEAGYDSYVVTQVDTVFIASKFRKRIMLQNTMTEYDQDVWVEGIGSLIFGLFSPGLSQSVTDWYSLALCFRENPTEEIYQIDTIYNECFMHLPQKNCNGVSAVSNTTQVLDFDLTLNAHAIHLSSATPLQQISIYDYCGQLIFQKDLLGATQVDLAHAYFSPGLYILHVQSKSGKASSKVVPIFR